MLYFLGFHEFLSSSNKLFLRNRKVIVNLSNKKLMQCSIWNMDGKCCYYDDYYYFTKLFLLYFLFIQRLEDHRRQRSSFGRLGVPKLG